MQINEPLIAELKHESASTRKMLERVPAESFGWKPHEKSMSLGSIAAHIASIPTLLNLIVEDSELDFATGKYKSKAYNETETLVKDFDENIAKGIYALQSGNNEALLTNWTLRSGDHVIFTLPRAVAVRSMVFNHLVHHRGQLSVYLRLLNIPVPGMYGPSYDDMNG